VDLAVKVQDRLASLTGVAITDVEVRPLYGGACQENFRVRLKLDGAPRQFALRSDAPTALPGSLGRRAEYAVIEAAAAAGARTPAARWLSAGLVRDGADAYFMDWIEGEAIGARVTRDPRLSEARANLPTALAQSLAAIHSVTPDAVPDLPIERPPFLPGVDPAQAALGFLSALLDRLPRRRPACEYILSWLQTHRPTAAPLALVHGDFRTGNFMVTPEGLTGVLDWEFAHWGDPAEDLAWLCVRDWRFGRIDRAAGGICDRATFYDAYAQATGRSVDPERVHFWEILGNLRWGAATAFQGLRYAAGQADLELLAIPRRAAEMEFEAMRLIEVGPPALTAER
jgi:aminoglycoside phosphotransferase (APT) family kinase protein